MKYLLCCIMAAMLGLSGRAAFAETIVLKSGKQIQAKILEKTKDYIKIDYKPNPLYYNWDNIDTIDGQPVPGRKQQAKPQQAQQQTAAAKAAGAVNSDMQALLDAKDQEIESLRSQLADVRKVQEDFTRLNLAYRKLQAKYLNNIGGTMLYDKEFDKAAAAFQQALDIDPWNPEACFNLAMLYDEYMKDPKAAVLFYERYLVLAPNASDRQEIEARIAQLKKG